MSNMNFSRSALWDVLSSSNHSMYRRTHSSKWHWWQWRCLYFQN